jgi:arsenate reductase (glutaredoxin)
MVTLFGISNCDTVKKSRACMDAQGITYTFHDFKKLGVPGQATDDWIKALGWEALVNKKGTTWRKLTAAEQAAVIDAASAKALMLAQPSVIKRPVVVAGKHISVGHCPQDWAQWALG